MTDITYDAEADAVYITVGRGKVDRTEEAGPFIYDVAAEGQQARQFRRLGAIVCDRHARAVLQQVARDRKAGLAKADHHRVQRHCRGCTHRSFNVDRPASTSRKLMIQKRTITLGSTHPLSSK